MSHFCRKNCRHQTFPLRFLHKNKTPWSLTRERTPLEWVQTYCKSAQNVSFSSSCVLEPIFWQIFPRKKYFLFKSKLQLSFWRNYLEFQLHNSIEHFCLAILHKYGNIPPFLRIDGICSRAPCALLYVVNYGMGEVE